MSWLSRLTVLQRLVLGYGVVLALLLVATGAGLFGVHRLYVMAENNLAVSVGDAQRASDIRILALMARRYEKDSFISLDQPKVHQGYRQKWQDNLGKLKAKVDEAVAAARTPEQREHAEQMSKHLAGYAGAFAQTLESMDKGLVGTAEDANRLFEKHKETVRAMDKLSGDMRDAAVAEAEA